MFSLKKENLISSTFWYLLWSLKIIRRNKSILIDFVGLKLIFSNYESYYFLDQKIEKYLDYFNISRCKMLQKLITKPYNYTKVDLVWRQYNYFKVDYYNVYKTTIKPLIRSKSSTSEYLSLDNNKK